MAFPRVTQSQFIGLLSAARTLLIAVGAILAAHGAANSTAYSWVEGGAGALLILGPAIWGVWAHLADIFQAQATGAAAGINMVASGGALDINGKLMPAAATPPAPVTIESAKQIVADYGQPTPTTSKGS